MSKKKVAPITDFGDARREKIRLEVGKDFGERNLKRLERIRKDALSELERIDREIEKQKRKLSEINGKLSSWFNPFK